MAAAPQLSAHDGTLPPHQDLQDYWEHAERAILGLGSGIDLELFSKNHVSTVAPIFLG